MKINATTTYMIVILLICSIAFNGFMYIHIAEQKTNIANMEEIQENTMQDIDKIKANAMTLKMDNQNKNSDMIKYQKANYYILAGDTAFIAGTANFADEFIYTAEIQKKNAIRYYKTALELLKDVDKNTSNETLSIRIDSQIHFVETVIAYVEADTNATGFYISSVDTYDDIELSGRYYNKYLDAYDEGTIAWGTYNEAYLKMLSDAGIVFGS